MLRSIPESVLRVTRNFYEKPVVAIREIWLSGLSNKFNRLPIQSGIPLSSLLRDRRRTASFTRAAEKLRIAQSAISPTLQASAELHHTTLA
jgi:hypothetical protein